MPTPDTRVLTAHMPAQLASKVDDIADRLDRSRGWVVKQALAAWVAQEEERHRLTLEGLADVDAGRAVDQGEVEAWAQSLASADPQAAAAVPVKWTSKALGDLARLHAFLAESNPRAAAGAVQVLTKGAGSLRDNPWAQGVGPRGSGHPFLDMK